MTGGHPALGFYRWWQPLPDMTPLTLMPPTCVCVNGRTGGNGTECEPHTAAREEGSVGLGARLATSLTSVPEADPADEGFAQPEEDFVSMLPLPPSNRTTREL